MANDRQSEVIFLSFFATVFISFYDLQTHRDAEMTTGEHWPVSALKTNFERGVTEKEEREKTKPSTDNNWSRGQRTHREQSWGQRVAVVVERSEA